MRIAEFLKTRGARRYAFNSGWLFADSLQRVLVSVVVGVYVARYLGPENFGVLSYALVIVGLIAPTWKLGFYPIINRDLIESADAEGKILGTAVATQVCAYLLVGTIFVGAVGITDGISTAEKWVLTTIFMAQAFLLTEACEQYFYARVEGKYVAISSIAAGLAAATLKFVGVLLQWNLLIFALLIAAEFMIKGIMLVIFYQYKSSVGAKGYYFDREYFRELVRGAWPFLLTGVVTGLYLKLDQAMIRYFLNNEAVGLYAVAAKLSEAWMLIPLVLTRSLFPAVLNAKARSMELFERRIVGLYSLLALFGLGLSIGCWSFREPIVVLLFGPEYSSAARILGVYAWAIPFIFINNAQWRWYIALGYQRLALVRILLALALNVALNIVLIERYGAIGAAYSTVVTYAFVGYLGNAISVKLRRNFVLISRALIFPVRGVKTVIDMQRHGG